MAPAWSQARGVACSISRLQPGAKNFGGLEGAGGWIGWSGTGLPKGLLMGTPAYIPQIDPHAHHLEHTRLG